MDDTKFRVQEMLDESAKLNADASDLYARYEEVQARADALENAAYDLEDQHG